MKNQLHFFIKLLPLIILAAFISCESSPEKTPLGRVDGPLFQKVPVAHSGIEFVNQIEEDIHYNHILQDGNFNGGGIAIVDINNDGLEDIYFAGNQVSDRLYLNKGNLQFEDITDKAGITHSSWSSAVAIADVNNDGYQDIYVGKFLYDPPARRINRLYINNGDLTFTEKAKAFGLADDGYCTAVNFFDFNNDGNLDLYVGNQPYLSRHAKKNPPKINDKRPFSDRLYRNNGNGSFTDVTEAAGITNFNYMLSATTADLNNDGWMDIYIACDFEEPDILYQNNGNGTFTNITNEALRHMSNFSMGADLADFNNDGWTDIYVADMVPADNYRLKANMGGMNPEKFWRLAKNNYHYQYMFNVLQLNNGNGQFSDVAQLAGVSNTDWSWASLLADFDNDGDKDLMVSNGLIRDVKNKDYEIQLAAHLDSLVRLAVSQGQKPQINSVNLLHLAPSVKIANYIYENNGDLSFTNRQKDWGFTEPTWSTGAAYADLDLDGDLDLLVYNSNDYSFLYENMSSEQFDRNYLAVSLEGDQGNNRLAYGAKVTIYTGEDMQMQEVSPTRGYVSSVSPILHFGLGDVKKVDRLVVRWLDGRQKELKDVEVNQVLKIRQQDADTKTQVAMNEQPTIFQKANTRNIGLDYQHQENEFDDYAREILLPHRMSTLGPALATADVDGDGREDVFVGGAAGQAGALYRQNATGSFTKYENPAFAKNAASEDTNALFFDADGDGDTDLYVISGGNEFMEGDQKLQDRLYTNDGKGNYQLAARVLPDLRVSTGAVSAGDYDGDGDLDLFVGGRQKPGFYGLTPASFILRNDKGTFTDVTKTVAPEIARAGMVSDASWEDVDGDGDADLFLAGEWMPLQLWLNESGQLTNETASAGLANTQGWWNRLAKADLDGDGDMDFIAGNLGHNIKYKATPDQPFTVFLKDFDNNGTHDVYLGYYDQDGVCYPVRGRECSSQQMPFIKKKFANYDKFAKSSIEDVLGDKREGAEFRQVKTFSSSWIENKGQGRFEVHELPKLAQIAPVNGILPADVNQDGHIDLIIAGNFYEREVETTRSDAGTGSVLINDGKGNFKALLPYQSGLNAYQDVRQIAGAKLSNGKLRIIVANNNAGLETYDLR